jgi:hypothetical protein
MNNTNSTEIHKFTNDFAATVKKFLKIGGIPVKLKWKNQLSQGMPGYGHDKHCVLYNRGVRCT